MMPNPTLIEPRFKESIDAFVLHGHQPGGFLTAVMTNDLMEAIGRGDDGALANLPHIVSYLYNDVPSGAWGSSDRFRDWGMRIRARVEAGGVA